MTQEVRYRSAGWSLPSGAARERGTVTKVTRYTIYTIYATAITAKTVAGIDSYAREGDSVDRGAIFGMIRVGSQVDIIVNWREGMTVRVRLGDRVRAGQTVLVERRRGKRRYRELSPTGAQRVARSP